MQDGKTIKQIAEEIGVSKQAVYKRYKGRLKEQLLPYVHTVDGVVYIQEQGESIIKRDFKETTANSGAHTDTQTDTPLDTVIDMLKNELEIKNRQIDELNARLAEAHAMINNGQLLQGGMIKQQLIEEKPAEPEPEKKKFFDRFRIK